jgi:hypothetical protein
MFSPGSESCIFTSESGRGFKIDGEGVSEVSLDSVSALYTHADRMAWRARAGVMFTLLLTGLVPALMLCRVAMDVGA